MDHLRRVTAKRRLGVVFRPLGLRALEGERQPACLIDRNYVFLQEKLFTLDNVCHTGHEILTLHLLIPMKLVFSWEIIQS